jgi:hypothetical protein
MRFLGALAVLCLIGAPAYADKKLNDLIKFYEKEARVCGKNVKGIGVAKDKAEPYKADAEITPDYEAVVKAHGVITAQCTELDGMLAFLKTDPKATYKQLQAEIDKRDKVIREGRKASKQALTDSDPVIKRLIPKVNKRAATAGK